MTYDPTIPFGAQNLSVTQAAILTNFDQLNTQYGVDHTAFNTGSGNGDGLHKKSTYVSQGGDPATGANQLAVYNKSDKLYARGQSNGTVYQLAGTFSSATNGYIQLYGNILMQWGTASIANGTTSIAVTFPVAFSSTPYSIQITPTGGVFQSQRVAASNPVSSTAFTITLGGPTAVGTTAYNWIAIGPA